MNSKYVEERGKFEDQPANDQATVLAQRPEQIISVWSFHDRSPGKDRARNTGRERFNGGEEDKGIKRLAIKFDRPNCSS